MFGRGDNFLAKGRWKRRNGFKQTFGSSCACQPGGPQAAADGAVTRTGLPKGCIFKGSLCLFYLFTTEIKYQQMTFTHLNSAHMDDLSTFYESKGDVIL